MAQPLKQGIDYFPYSIGLLRDRKLRSLKLKYGAIAGIVYLALLEMIYGDKGYYLEYESQKDDVIWELLNYLQGAFQPTAKTVSDVIDGLVACELISSDHYPKIITSKRVQATYYKAVADRKAVDVNFDVWLLSEAEMTELSAKCSILKKFQDRPIYSINRPIYPVNHPIYKHSRVEESKVNNIPSARARVDGGIPSLDEVVGFCRKYNITTDPNWFYEYNQKRAWRINGEPIRHWQALLMQWGKHAPGDADKAYTTRKYTDAELNALVDDINKVEF